LCNENCKVTDIAKMPTIKGKDGEVKMFKDGEKVFAYCFKAGI